MHSKPPTSLGRQVSSAIIWSHINTKNMFNRVNLKFWTSLLLSRNLELPDGANESGQAKHKKISPRRLYRIKYRNFSVQKDILQLFSVSWIIDYILKQIVPKYWPRFFLMFLYHLEFQFYVSCQRIQKYLYLCHSKLYTLIELRIWI